MNKIQVTPKKILIIAIYALLIYSVYYGYKRSTPLTEEEFIQLMSAEGYGIIDKLSYSGDWDLIKNTYYPGANPNVVDYDDEDELSVHLIAKNESSATEIVYKRYHNETEAKTSFLKYENSKRFNTLGGRMTTSDAQNAVRRGGGNTGSFYMEDISGNYFLLSRLKDSVMISFIEPDDVEKVNKILNKVGYGVKSLN